MNFSGCVLHKASNKLDMLCKVDIAHPVAIVSDELQQIEGLIAAVHLKIQLPCAARIATAVMIRDD